MNNDYKSIFNLMLERLKLKNSSDIVNVVNAFKFAEQQHKGQFRKSGHPYILHPVCVAKILEELDFNTDVISAAILHDTVEDCGITPEELEKKFNKQMAQIVDSVTEITKENFSPDIEDIYADTTNFLKLAIDDKTYQKLISMGKNNKFAFYIKFADRLDNLKTIGVFPKHKKLAKIEETQKWIVPLAKILKSRFFYWQLQNQCFKIKHEETGLKFFEFYNRFISNNNMYIEAFKQTLQGEINTFLRSSKNSFLSTHILVEPRTELEIYEDICKYFDISNIEKIKESNLIKIPTYNIFVIFNGQKNEKELLTITSDLLQSQNFTNTLKIINVQKDIFDYNFLVLQDKIKLKFNLISLSIPEYIKLKNGSASGSDIDLVDETTSGEIATSYITVLTRSGEKIKLPQGATVLDFAFKLHKDLGFSCKYALINDSQNKAPIHTKLANGDKIIVVNETNEDGLAINRAQFRWIAYAKTESAQRALIKYFEKRYSS